MGAIDLTPEERELLVEVLENYLSDLRAEISDTDSFTFKSQLKERKETLKDIVVKLKESQ